MSRIQNILEKAERDGAVRRVRGVDMPPTVLGASAQALAADVPASAIEGPPLVSPGMLDELGRDVDPGAGAAFTGPAVVKGRGLVVPTTRLDRSLVAISASSTAAEQYRGLRTRILHADTGAAVNVLLVTSPGRGEGKTTTASNLALTMAQEYQRRICLVDADLRNPRIRQMFGLPEGPGLCDVLTAQAALDDALITIEDLQLTVLPAGRAEGHPAELLGTTAMRRTIDTLRSLFDCVVIDATATAPLADVGILAPLVDSVLLVVRSAVTSKPAIHDAIASLDPAKLLGVVLNDAAQD